MIALIADLQFDDRTNLSSGVVNGVSSRLNDIRDAVKWFVQDAQEQGVDTVFILGDWHDSRESISVTTLSVSSECMHLICNSFDQVYYIPGNHDCALHSTEHTSIDVFAGVTQIAHEPMVVDVHDLTVGLVPWNHDPEVIRASVEGLPDCDLLMSHCLLEGIFPSKKKAGVVPSEYLQPERFQHVYLGDVHAPCSPAEGVSYVGALMAYDFRDADTEARGYMIIDPANPDDFEHRVNQVSPRFYIIDSIADTPEDVEARDYVRVKPKSQDDELTEEEAHVEADALRSHGVWVEGCAVVPDEPEVRLVLDDTTSSEEVIQAYAEHKGTEDEQIVAAGIALLQEAKGLA